MLGLRDLVLIAPTPTMHQQSQPINSDHHPNLPIPSSASLGVSLGIFPLLTATPCITPPSNHGVQDCGNNSNNPNCYWSLKRGQEQSCGKKDGVNNNTTESDDSEQMLENSMRVCKDCGNRAKKDCSHRSASHASTSNATTPRSIDISSRYQDASFKKSLPGQVRAPAVFRCHRVTTISDGAAEFVYQATVSISGHVFRGYLYDQGFDEKNAFPSISQLHLVSSGSGRKRDASSSPIVAPSNSHPAPVS
nr:protein lateral root primordium 1 [Quercus suber]